MGIFFAIMAGIFFGVIIGGFVNAFSALEPRGLALVGGGGIALVTILVAISSPPLGVPIAVLTIFFYVEAIGWLVQLSKTPPRVTIDHQSLAAHLNSTAVLVFHGLMGNEKQLESQYDELSKWGDIYTVNTHGEVYDPKLVAETAARVIREMVTGSGMFPKYNNVVLVGISLGGRMAFESLKQFQQTTNDFDSSRVRVVLMGTPIDYHSVYGSKIVKIGSLLVSRLVPGYALNAVGSRLMQAMFRPPKLEDTEYDADEFRILDGVEAAKKTPFRVWLSQLYAFAGRPAPAVGSWSNLAAKTVYVWYSHDRDTVDQPAAFATVTTAIGGAPMKVVCPTTHCGFDQAPRATTASLVAVCSALDLPEN